MTGSEIEWIANLRRQRADEARLAGTHVPPVKPPVAGGGAAAANPSGSLKHLSGKNTVPLLGQRFFCLKRGTNDNTVECSCLLCRASHMTLALVWLWQKLSPALLLALSAACMVSSTMFWSREIFHNNLWGWALSLDASVEFMGITAFGLFACSVLDALLGCAGDASYLAKCPVPLVSRISGWITGRSPNSTPMLPSSAPHAAAAAAALSPVDDLETERHPNGAEEEEEETHQLLLAAKQTWSRRQRALTSKSVQLGQNVGEFFMRYARLLLLCSNLSSVLISVAVRFMTNNLVWAEYALLIASAGIVSNSLYLIFQYALARVCRRLS